MPTLIVKAAVSFLNDDSDAQLITDTNGIVLALTGNPTYPNPTPTLAVVSSALDAFRQAVAEAAGGGVALTTIKNERRAELVALMRVLAACVQMNCGGNLVKLQSSGFPTHKPVRQPVGVLAPPKNLRLSLGMRSGELYGKADPVKGVSTYTWRVMRADSPDETVQAVQTTAAGVAFSGLTPGVNYQVEVNAVGAAGPSDWSDAASQMVI